MGWQKYHSALWITHLTFTQFEGVIFTFPGGGKCSSAYSAQTWLLPVVIWSLFFLYFSTHFASAR